MPIYAYRCAACGFANDHLQRLSVPVLCICPQCAQAAYCKQVTAAGFQLKGNGWYATDFKNGQGKAPAAETPVSPEKPASSEKVPAAAGATGVGVCADN